MCLRHLNKKEQKKKKKKVKKRKRERARRKKPKRRGAEKKESRESSLVHDYMVVTDFLFLFFFQLFIHPAEISILAKIGWNDQNSSKWAEIFSEVEERGFSF